MALFRLKISLPDQPGSLGAIASAIGAAGCDIRSLSVLEAKDGIGYDEFLVAVPGTDSTDLVTVLSSMGGVTVISIEAITQ
uniref:ACT domain-containing protein n=1 Tax=Candidatus Planktophila sp. TaxID=2175601 RepID=UPI004049DB01